MFADVAIFLVWQYKPAQLITRVASNTKKMYGSFMSRIAEAAKEWHLFWFASFFLSFFLFVLAAHLLHLPPAPLYLFLAKDQISKALFRSGNGAGGAEICKKAINGCSLLKEGGPAIGTTW